MTAFQPREHLHAAVQRAHDLLVKDLQAIDADKQTESLAGCARPALPMLVECASVNSMVATYLTTGEVKRLSPEEREAFMARFDTAEKTLAFLEEATGQLLAAIDGLDEATLGDVSDALFGSPRTRFAIAELPATHMMYHDGQLNYIQTLHGDDQMHW